MMKEIFEQISLIYDALYSGDNQKIENTLRMAEQWLYIEADKEKLENTQEFQLGRLDGYIEACEDMYHLNHRKDNNLT